MAYQQGLYGNLIDAQRVNSINAQARARQEDLDNILFPGQRDRAGVLARNAGELAEAESRAALDRLSLFGPNAPAAAPSIMLPDVSAATTVRNRNPNAASASTQSGSTLATSSPDPLANVAPSTARSLYGVVERGNIDLAARTPIQNADGTISTIESITVTTPDGSVVLIPTILSDGTRLTPQQAYLHYQDTGENLGIFISEASADAYARLLSEQLGRYYGGRR